METSKPKRKQSRSRKSIKSETQPQVESIPSFALVLYSSDKTKGVVLTKSIPKKSRLKGSTCKAPNPIHLGNEEDKSKHDCFVIEFGADIDELYAISLLKTGMIDPYCYEEELIAQKREYRESSKSKEERKRENLRKFEEDVSGQDHIFMSKTDGQTSTNSIHNKLEVATGHMLLAVNTQSVTSTLEGFNHDTSKDDSSDHNRHPPIQISADSQNTESSFAPLQEVVALLNSGVAKGEIISESPGDNFNNYDETRDAEPTSFNSVGQPLDQPQMELMNWEFQKNNSLHTPLQSTADERLVEQSSLICGENNSLHTPLQSTADERLVEQSSLICGDHMLLKGAEQRNPDQTSAHYKAQAEQTTGSSTFFQPGSVGSGPSVNCLAFDIQELECSKPGGPDEKFALSPLAAIYIKKPDYLSLPLLSPTGAQRVGKSKNPREMVTHLIKILLPESVRKNVLRTNIPPNFFEAIKIFLNIRLPLEHKETDADIAKYIYDACRLKQRDRKAEAQKRQWKIENNIPLRKRKDKTADSGNSKRITIHVEGGEISIDKPANPGSSSL